MAAKNWSSIFWISKRKSDNYFQNIVWIKSKFSLTARRAENPGPSSIGIVIEIGGTKKTYREFIGYATNNEAEYKALIFALRKVKLLLGKTKSKTAALECFSDSELVVKQLTHKYKVLEENIQKFFLLLWNLSD